MHEYDIAYMHRAQRVDRFIGLLYEAIDGEAFTITGDGVPVAVVMGIDEYERLSAAAGETPMGLVP